jgi:hypothetical protein
MSKTNWWLVMASTGIVALIVILFLLPVRLSSVRDFGQWDRNDPCAMVSHPDDAGPSWHFMLRREIPTSLDSAMPVTAKHSNALSIGFADAAVRNLRGCDGYQRRPSDPAVD